MAVQIFLNLTQSGDTWFCTPVNTAGLRFGVKIPNGKTPEEALKALHDAQPELFGEADLTDFYTNPFNK